MDEQIKDAPLAVYMNGQKVGEIPEIEAEAIAEKWNLGTIEKTENALTLELDEKTQKALQDLGEVLTEQFEKLRDAIINIGRQIVEAFRPHLEKMQQLVSEDLIEYIRHQKELKSVATPRQWHLYQHGRYRTSKKWENALEKRLQNEKRRKRMKSFSKYYECPYCGVCLDPGERCECQDKEDIEQKKREEKRTNENRSNPQYYRGYHPAIDFKDTVHVYGGSRASSF